MSQSRIVFVCQYQNCLRNGSAAVLQAFQATPLKEVEIVATSCLGQCSTGPTVHVVPDQVWYCRVQPSDVPAIATQHLEGNQPVASLLHPRFHRQYY